MVGGDPEAQKNISETRPEVKKEILEKVVDETKRGLQVQTSKTVPETPQTDPEEAKKAPVAHEMVPEPPVDVGLPQQQGRTLLTNTLMPQAL